MGQHFFDPQRVPHAKAFVSRLLLPHVLLSRGARLLRDRLADVISPVDGFGRGCLPMQTPKIVTARKLEAQVQSVAIMAFAPSHDALDSLACIHSLHFHQLPNHDRKTARECSSVLAHFSHQRLFGTSLTGRFKTQSHWDRDASARATAYLSD